VRVCVVAEYYPRPDDPVSGVWAHRQALAARDAGADVRVLVLDRPLPSAASLREAGRGRPGRLVSETHAAIARPRTAVLDGIEVEYVRYMSPPRSSSYARWHRWARRPLAAALRRGPELDLVHAHYAHLAGAAALEWTAPRRTPLVVSVHGGDVLAPTLSRPEARGTIGRVLSEASGVICNSRGTQRLAAALAGHDEHMRVVHLGTDIPAGGDLPPKHERPTIATLAHADPRKRHEDVLRALALLPPEVRWTAIGGGPELERLEALARELGIAERVTLLGRLPPDEAHAELARCHVMALPSVDEAFGVAYVEALARGVPAIGCEGEMGPEEIAGLTGGMLLVPRRDPPALAGAIQRALADPDLPARARAGAAAHFTWERCGAETVAAYQAALDR
jgi:teichuronic acid biosynthesis glycosyltransferase TuaC